MIDIGLVLARLLHYAAATTLAGLSFFPLYAYSDFEPEGLHRWRRRLLLFTAIVALFSGLLWFVFSIANMTGSLGNLADPEVVWSVVLETSFGVVWTMRMALAAVIVGLTAMRPFPKSAVIRDQIISLLSAALLVSLAGTGHSQIEEGWMRFVHVGFDAAHLLAAGAWLGGLVLLGFILVNSTATNRNAGATDVDGILVRFSGMGYIAVATLIGSGLINSWFLVGSLRLLLDTSYGRILLVKLAFFAAMLALAAANRFWLVPSMSASRVASSGPSSVWTGRLRAHVIGEQILGLTILLVVSVLGTMPPAAGQ